MHGERWAKRLGMIATLATLVLAGCTGTTSEVGEEGRAIAARFLDELRTGRLEPAWQDASTEFKSLMGLESLRDYVKTHPALKAPAIYAESRTFEGDGRAMAEYVFHASTKRRGKSILSTIKVLLAAGEDGWKVEHLVAD